MFVRSQLNSVENTDHRRSATPSTRERLAEAEDAKATREIRLLLGVLLVAALVVAQCVFVPMARGLSEQSEREMRPEIVGAAGSRSCAGAR